MTNQNARCVIDTNGTGWQVSNCNEASFFACEKPANVTGQSTTQAQTTPTPTPTSTPNPCGTGWVSQENTCWNFDPTKRTWFEGAYYCYSQGGWIATIHNRSDDDFLYCKEKNLTRKQNF